ncbi:ROK family transcriptional regulator [Alicyclobacillus fastidiosus]|uniref:ROK family transcriptional regulator n=1 Tax=Alicyclobacillus fastidiosus TaxID=392011 RepID=A0ABY6ZAW2_9BACL|nr:ROK family transcriptional regulator [Alicyclobacillus fastidiosus]WAH39969.1 ROK family transcriptional regulator [Alicyclobacillus fastidiosus]
MQVEKRTPSTMGRANKANVLHLIKEHGPMSRASVARTLNMSRSTISSIVDQLINEGRIREGATGQSTSAGGRRPVYLNYVASAKYALGIDIGGTKTIAMITDLDGNVVVRRKFQSHASGTNSMDHILREVHDVIQSSGISPTQIIGTGIGFPGVTSADDGVVVQAPGLHLDQFPATNFFQSLPGDIWIDNDVNMGVIGERWKGAAQGQDNVVLIAVGTGIGAGLILGGKVYRGGRGYAGEIGHLHIDPFTTKPKLSLGDYGPLEQTASGQGMEQLALAKLKEFPDTSLTPDDVSVPLLFEAAKRGDTLASDVLRQATTYLAFSIANIVTLLNPDVVIVGGGVSRVGRPLIDELARGVARLSPVPCKVVLAGLGEDAAAFGGAATVLLKAGELRLTGFDDALVERGT